MKGSIAWAAGLFEGEGCIATRKHRPPWRPTLYLTLASTDEDVVRKFAEVVGSGRVYGPYKTTGKRPIWKWLTYSRNARRIAKSFWPYLGARRKAKYQETEVLCP